MKHPEIKAIMLDDMIESIRDMVRRHHGNIQSAFNEHGGDWFSLNMKIKLREINQTKIETIVAMDFSKGKTKEKAADIVDTKQLPMFPPEG